MNDEYFQHDHERLTVKAGEWIATTCVPPHKPSVYFKVTRVNKCGIWMSNEARRDHPNGKIHDLMDIGLIRVIRP